MDARSELFRWPFSSAQRHQCGVDRFDRYSRSDHLVQLCRQIGWGDVLASRAAGVHTMIGENDPGALSFRALDRRPNIGWSCGLHHVKIHQIVWAQVAAVCSTGRSAASLEELRRNCLDSRVVTAVGISAVGWCNAELGLYRCLRVRKFCCDLSTGESREVGMIPSVVSDFITLCDQLFCLGR